jgi:PAS domain S-box-containing protein
VRSRGAGAAVESALTPSDSGGGDGGAEVAAEQFRLLVDSVRDYAIFLLDPGGRVASWNAGAERIKGYEAAEILGRHFSTFYPPEDAAAGKPAESLARAARDGSYQGGGWRVRKDGGRFYARVTITALFDEQGQLKGFAKITQDVTAEREADRTLHEREQQLAEAQAIARVGSFEWDLARDKVSWSAELGRIYGFDPDRSSGGLEELLQGVHPDDRAVAAAAVRCSARDGTPFRIELRIVRPDGEQRLVTSWGEVARDERGRPARVLGVCQDVTEWRQREAQFVEAHAQVELSRQLQSGLLPSLSLRTRTLTLRTRYQAGQERALLGADFFDALELPDGTVALLIGDVAGHGPDEAAVGVALRAAWRALVLTGHQAGELLNGLDKVLVRERPSDEVFTTVCCAWVSADRSRVTVALAGHPPPLLARDVKVEAVAVPGGPALGIYDGGYQWESGVLEVGDTWTLLCYTDGLVEGRREPGSLERFGIEALRGTAAALVASRVGLDELVDGLLDVVHTANGGDLSDDVAILCVGRCQRTAGHPGPAAQTEMPTGLRG